MKNFVIVADQDRGKSFFVKNEILRKFQKNRRNFIFDVNFEYGSFKNLNKYLSRYEFLKNTPNEKNSNCNVVFEEATAFFSKSGNTSRDTVEHICRRFHSKNINVFVFHALDQVPTDILYFIDFIVIFRTLDNPEKIQKTFAGYPKILEAFNDVRNKTANTYFNRDKKSYPDQHSKDFFHYKRVICKPY